VARRYERVSRLLQDRRERVEHHQLRRQLAALDHDVDRIEDGRAVEEQLERDLPDRLDVAVADEQRGQQHARPRREQRQRRHEQRQLQPAQPHIAAGDEQEHDHRAEVERHVEQRGEHGRERNGQPRELHLADQRLPIHKRRHRAARGLGEEGEDDDAEQQRDGIELYVASQPHNLGEHDVEHAEQQQRPHELPQVAERRAEEAQLEVAYSERARQVPQAPRIVPERRRALDRWAQLRVRAQEGTSSGADAPAARSTWTA
jgi:hypothetical protein